MSEIVDLNYGTNPNDHTGDGLFYIFQKIHNNTQLLKNLQGPCVGTKYTDVRLATKAFSICEKQPSPNYYISKIVSGVPESGKYRYTIEISKSLDYAVAGGVIVSNTKLSTALRTGRENVPLGNSLLLNTWGHLLIDWDLLTPNTTYTMSVPGEGYLFATCVAYATGTIKPIITPGPDPWDEPSPNLCVLPITEATTIDGSYDKYLVTEHVEISLESGELIQGRINVKNISGSAIAINCPPIPPLESGPMGTAQFDNVYLQITVEDKESVSFELYEIEPNSFMTIVTGRYTGIEA